MHLTNSTILNWLFIAILTLLNLQPTQASEQEQEQNQQAQPTAAPQLDIEIFTKLPYTRQVEISPDGKHIAIIFKRDGEDMLAIIQVADMKPVKVIKARGQYNQIGQAIWANNERVLYNILSHVSWDKELFYNGELYGVNIDGRKHKAIMGPKAKRRNNGKRGKFGHHEIIDLLPDDKKHILVAFYPWREGMRYFYNDHKAEPLVYKVNIYNPRVSTVTTLPMPLASAITDNNHQVRLSIAINEERQLVLHHRKDNDAQWQPLELKGLPQRERTAIIKFADDNNKVYLTVDEAQGPDILYLYDLDSHKAEKIYQHKVSDIKQLVYNQSGQKVVGLSVEADYPQYFFIDAEDIISKIHKQLLKKLRGYNIRVTSTSENTERVIIEVFSDYDPGGYYLYQTKTGAIKQLLDKKQWITPDYMASREPVKFKARDGLTLHGYLTRPLGKTQSLPTVILPHGGPHGIKESWAFDWQSQLLANRGYAVLQLNYRGSGGYGYAFEKAGFGQWGAAMQDDLTDATKQLIEQGIADKNRICIYGASYGGYAALMGTIREPELYQCAIGSVGVYSLPLMFQEGDITDSKQGISYLKNVLGEDQNKLKTYSPAYNTDKIKAPLLLIHGSQDQRAPIEHLEALEQGLKANNKSYEKMILTDEGHGYYDEGNRVKVYSKILEFLDKHIGE